MLSTGIKLFTHKHMVLISKKSKCIFSEYEKFLHETNKSSQELEGLADKIRRNGKLQYQTYTNIPNLKGQVANS